MKRFKTKRKHPLIKLIILCFIFIGSTFISCVYFIEKDGHKIDKDKLIKYLINEGFNCEFSDLMPLKEDNNTLNVSSLSNSIKEPIVYLYNTHDEEKYNYILNGAYNIIPNVRLASLILEEKLNDMGISTISEDINIQDILNDNNWSYKDSYKASRILLDKRLKEYNSLKYFIDIHRDSTSKDNISLKYNNDTYARMLFVIGKENNNYLNNLDMANKISDYVNELVPNLSRGVSLKEGPGVNGIYNQDFSSNLILIEVGGDQNNIIDVSNSINILAESLYKYIKGDNDAKKEI